jgi:penicillin-binding protein 1A
MRDRARTRSRTRGPGTRPGRAVASMLALSLTAGACSLSPIDLSEERPLALRTTITAADGALLARLFRENRELASLEEMPPVLVEAVLAAEDARFFDHPGYDLRSIARAALVNLSEGKVLQGGSTITQQYVKNTFFRRPARTLERKARELRLAIEVERRYSKNEILERYLNTVYLGQGAYGAKAAIETYFERGRNVSSLRLPEAALLAGLIKAPSYFDPREHPKRARQRRNWVIGRMADLDMVTDRAALRAKRRRIDIRPAPPRLSTRQPYFVEAVKQEVVRNRRLGRTPEEREKLLYRGGLKIETTLDRRLQSYAEDAVEGVLGDPGDPEVALVAIRPKSGEIVAMVGGRDWSQSQVNLALGRMGGGSGRQPGSSFKPIAAAAALEAGIGLGTRFDASPAIFHLPDGSTWQVRNSEGTSSGSLPLDEALVRSVNAVFARVALELGAGRLVTQAKLMGIRSHLPVYPSIVLGSGEVSALDMAAAYATLANQGTAIEPTTIRKITLATGEILRPDRKVVRDAVSPGNAYLLTKVLEQVIERGTGRAAAIGRPAAGKTGTTNDYTDAWFVGYTPQLVTSVWVGYPLPRPMTNVHGISVFGGTFPALIWKAFMSRALEGKPVQRFELPTGELVTVEIDPVTGLLSAPWCPGKPKRMLRQLAPTEYCPPPPPPAVETPAPTPSPTGSGRNKAEPSPAKDEKQSPSPEPTRNGKSQPSPSPSG